MYSTGMWKIKRTALDVILLVTSLVCDLIFDMYVWKNIVDVLCSTIASLAKTCTIGLMFRIPNVVKN